MLPGHSDHFSFVLTPQTPKYGTEARRNKRFQHVDIHVKN